MPELPVVGDSLSKKLGPLPLWGWGLAIGGGYLGYRFLTAKGGSSTSTASPPSTTDTTLSGNNATIIDQLTKDIAGLGTEVGNLSDANTLLTQLNSAINNRATALSIRDRNQRALSDLQIRYRDKKVSKHTYDVQSKQYKASIASQSAKVSALDKLIASLKSKLAALGA